MLTKFGASWLTMSLTVLGALAPPHLVQSAQSCPPGSSLIAGRCFTLPAIETAISSSMVVGRGAVHQAKLNATAVAAVGAEIAQGRLGPADGEGGAVVDLCVYSVTTNPETVKLYGHDGTKGFMVSPSCPEAVVLKSFNAPDLGEIKLAYHDQPSQFVLYSAGAAAPPPPDPADLAVDAIADLPIPNPTPLMGPDDPDDLIVHKPVWLWTEDPGELTSTVALLGVEVTSTARLTKTTWNMGEAGMDGIDTSIVVCEGAGSPTPSYEERGPFPQEWDPECGYEYSWRSLPERTKGVGRWPVHVETEWTVTWVANTGETGGSVIVTSADTSVRVQEIRTVLINGDGG